LILSARQVSNGQAFMSAQAKASEPSMEEILASIRRIISDDDAKPAEGEAAADAAAAAAPAPAPAPAAEAEPAPPAAVIDEDVLDLGAEAALIAAPPPEPPAPQPAPAPAMPAAEEPDVAFVEEAPAAPPPAPEPAPLPPAAVFIPSAAPAVPAMDMASLLSDQASSAVTNAFGHLANTVLSNNARTLEDLVKEMLKPMLKAWLDDNLPTMVERLVRTEIERVARGGRN